MIKIIEGTAAEIEKEGNKLGGFELDSIQFTSRGKIYMDDGRTTVSNDEYNFYVAVFNKKDVPWD